MIGAELTERSNTGPKSAAIALQHQNHWRSMARKLQQAMSHLDSLIVEYLDWQGHLVHHNIKVQMLKHVGWEMELDVIGYNQLHD